MQPFEGSNGRAAGGVERTLLVHCGIERVAPSQSKTVRYSEERFKGFSHKFLLEDFLRASPMYSWNSEETEAAEGPTGSGLKRRARKGRFFSHSIHFKMMW